MAEWNEDAILGYLYKYGSLKNFDDDGDGIPDGFQFSFACPIARIYFFSCHRLILTVNGKEIGSESITLSSNNETHSAIDLFKTHFMVLWGHAISVRVGLKGGLKHDERHRVLLKMVGSGDFGGKGSGGVLAKFEDHLQG